MKLPELKKRFTRKYVIRIIAGVLVVGMVGTGVSTANVFAAKTAQESTESTESTEKDSKKDDSDAESKLKDALDDSIKFSEKEIGKEETVYVLADSTGKERKVIVSDHLINDENKDTIEDASTLKDIENVKGDETFKQDGSKLTWQADGNDIYYQGTSTKETPVSQTITYSLDGKEVKPEELAGKSGKVTIRFDYTNNETVKTKIGGKEDKLRVYTTRCDTLFGATYMVVSPEHPIIDKYKDELKNWDAIAAYREEAAKKSDFERSELAKDKTGVEIDGLMAVNPVTGKEIPIWISDYVLMSYGTGAIMAVPAHDERDWEFAKKFNIPMVQVVAKNGEEVDINEAAFTDVATGVLINSEFLNGLEVKDAKAKMIAFLEEKGIGTAKTNYKLRDWVFSRQRYWGEPIPIVHCDKCGYVPIDESELPLMLPEVESYMPTDNGESPLAAMTDWVNTTCPCCGGPAKRETDTMPQWAGSSWYFLRYTDPHNDEALASPEALKYWMPVDWYNGGMEHTTLHLLYSRFWHKFLYDEKVVPCPEPYQKRTSHGMILGENGEKMSKSRGNVVNPDDIVREYGADTLRTYEMFIGAFDLSASWSEDGVKGCRRFLERVWKLQDIMTDETGYSKELETKMHQTIKKVSSDYENLKYNTAIAAMMALINEFYKKNAVTKGEYETLLILLNPVAPHITEELWQIIGGTGYVYQQKWPEFDEAKTVENTVEIAVQINGKTKGTLAIGRNDAKDDVIAKAKESIADKLTGNIVKEIYVPGRIVNIVMK